MLLEGVFPVADGVDLSPPRLNGADLFPPRLNVDVGFEAGCDDCPRLNAGLLAGVAAGVVLPKLNKDALGVACGPASPPRMLGCADASFLPKPNEPRPPAAGWAKVELAGVPPNNGVEDVAGLALPPNREGAELAAVPVFPNKLVPGGGPAGVVDGSAKVLLGAGVAAGVEDSKKC